MPRRRIVRADLRADAILQRRDDLAARGVVLGVGAEDQQHVERQPDRIALDLDVPFLEDVEQADLDLAGEIRQLVDREDAAVRPRQQPVVHRQLVGELQRGARRLDRIEVADHVGDGHVGRRELLDVARVARQPRDRQRRPLPRDACAARGTERRERIVVDLAARARPGSLRRAGPASARRMRLFACPRRPSRMKLWRDRMALTICGTTVSS